MVKDRNWDAPFSLSRNTPIRASLSHSFDAADSSGWNPLNLLYFFHRLCFESFYWCKPLLCSSKDDWFLCTPVIRIPMCILLSLQNCFTLSNNNIRYAQKIMKSWWRSQDMSSQSSLYYALLLFLCFNTSKMNVSSVSIINLMQSSTLVYCEDSFLSAWHYAAVKDRCSALYDGLMLQ